jgi:hypothetical protein
MEPTLALKQCGSGSPDVLLAERFALVIQEIMVFSHVLWLPTLNDQTALSHRCGHLCPIFTGHPTNYMYLLNLEPRGVSCKAGRRVDQVFKFYEGLPHRGPIPRHILWEFSPFCIGTVLPLYIIYGQWSAYVFLEQ